MPDSGGVLGDDMPMEIWTQTIKVWGQAQKAAGAPSTTLRTRTEHLMQLARAFPESPWTISADAIVEWLGTKDWARETRRSRRTTYLNFYRWAIARGLTDYNVAEAIPRISSAIGAPRPTPDSVLEAALEVADDRQRLIIYLAAQMGLRRSEIAQIHSDDLIEDLVGWSLVVHGKGSKNRTLPLTPRMAFDIRGHGDGYLFPGQDNGHLSPNYMGRLISRLMPAGWTLHTLRHRFATQAYGIDRDVFVVQELLGHSSPATTRRYVQLSDESMRRTIMAMAS